MIQSVRKFFASLLTSKDSRLLLLTLVTVALYLSMSLFVQARYVLIYDETSDFSAYYAAYIVKREVGSGIYDRTNFQVLPAA